jgi:hypothetical protein
MGDENEESSDKGNKVEEDKIIFAPLNISGFRPPQRRKKEKYIYTVK